MARRIHPHEILAGEGKLAHEVMGSVPPPAPHQQVAANNQAAQEEAARRKAQEQAEAEQRRVQKEEAARQKAESEAAQQAEAAAAAAEEQRQIEAAEAEQRRVQEEERVRRIQEERERIREEERNETAADRYWSMKRRQEAEKAEREAKEQRRRERLNQMLYGNPRSPLYGQDPAFTDDESLPNRWSRQRRLENLSNQQNDKLYQSAKAKEHYLDEYQKFIDRRQVGADPFAQERIAAREASVIQGQKRQSVEEAQERVYNAVRETYLNGVAYEKAPADIEAIQNAIKNHKRNATGNPRYADPAVPPELSKQAVADYQNVLAVLKGDAVGDPERAVAYLRGLSQAEGHANTARALYDEGKEGEDINPGRTVGFHEGVADRWSRIADHIEETLAEAQRNENIRQNAEQAAATREAGLISPGEVDLAAVEQIRAVEESATQRSLVASNAVRQKYADLGITPDKGGSVQHGPLVISLADQAFNALPETVRGQGYTVVVLDEEDYTEIARAAGGGQAGLQAVKQAQAEGDERYYLGNTVAETGGTYWSPGVIHVDIIQDLNEQFASTSADQRAAAEFYNQKLNEALVGRGMRDSQYTMMPPETFAAVETTRYILQNPEEFTDSFVRGLESQVERSEMDSIKAAGREPARRDASLRAQVYSALPEGMRPAFREAAKGKTGDALLEVAGQFTQPTEGMIADYGLTPVQVERLRAINDTVTDPLTQAMPDSTFLEDLSDFLGPILDTPIGGAAGSLVGVNITLRDIAEQTPNIPMLPPVPGVNPVMAQIARETGLPMPTTVGEFAEGVAAVVQEVRVPDLHFDRRGGRAGFDVDWEPGDFREPTAQEWGWAAAASALGLAFFTGGLSLVGAGGFFTLGAPGVLAVGSGTEMAAAALGAPEGNFTYGPTNALDVPRQIMYKGLREAGFSKEEATILSVLGDIIFWTAPGFAMLPKILKNYRVMSTLRRELGKDAANIAERSYGIDNLDEVIANPESLEGLKRAFADPEIAQEMVTRAMQEQYMNPSRIPIPQRVRNAVARAAERVRTRRFTDTDIGIGIGPGGRRTPSSIDQDMAGIGAGSGFERAGSVSYDAGRQLDPRGAGFTQTVGPVTNNPHVRKYFEMLLERARQSAIYSDEAIAKAGFTQGREEVASALGMYAHRGFKDPRLEKLFGKYLPDFKIHYEDGIPVHFDVIPGSYYDTALKLQLGKGAEEGMEVGGYVDEAGDVLELTDPRPLTADEALGINRNITEQIRDEFATREFNRALRALGMVNPDGTPNEEMAMQVYLHYRAEGTPPNVGNWPGWFRDEVERRLQRRAFQEMSRQNLPGQAQMGVDDFTSIYVGGDAESGLHGTFSRERPPVSPGTERLVDWHATARDDLLPIPRIASERDLGQWEDVLYGRVERMFVNPNSYADRYLDTLYDQLNLHWSHPEAFTLEDLEAAGFRNGIPEAKEALNNFKNTGTLDSRLEVLFPGKLRFDEALEMEVVEDISNDYAQRYLASVWRKLNDKGAEDLQAAGYIPTDIGNPSIQIYDDAIKEARKDFRIFLDTEEISPRLAKLLQAELRPGSNDAWSAFMRLQASNEERGRRIAEEVARDMGVDPADLPPFPHLYTTEGNAEDLLTVQALLDIVMRNTSKAYGLKGKPFTDVVAFYQDWFRAQWETLTDIEKEAIKVYQSMDYETVFRGGVTSSATGETLASALDSAIEKVRLPRDTTLYRGVKMEAFPQKSGKPRKTFRVGEVLRSNQTWTSTSIDPQVGYSYVPGVGQAFSERELLNPDRGVLLVIHAPKGTPGLGAPTSEFIPEALAKGEVLGYTNEGFDDVVWHNEFEVLLPRNVQFRVTKVGKVKDYVGTPSVPGSEKWTAIEVEIVGTEPLMGRTAGEQVDRTFNEAVGGLDQLDADAFAGTVGEQIVPSFPAIRSVDPDLDTARLSDLQLALESDDLVVKAVARSIDGLYNVLDARGVTAANLSEDARRALDELWDSFDQVLTGAPNGLGEQISIHQVGGRILKGEATTEDFRRWKSMVEDQGWDPEDFLRPAGYRVLSNEEILNTLSTDELKDLLHALPKKAPGERYTADELEEILSRSSNLRNKISNIAAQRAQEAVEDAGMIEINRLMQQGLRYDEALKQAAKGDPNASSLDDTFIDEVHEVYDWLSLDVVTDVGSKPPWYDKEWGALEEGLLRSDPDALEAADLLKYIKENYDSLIREGSIRENNKKFKDLIRKIQDKADFADDFEITSEALQNLMEREGLRSGHLADALTNQTDYEDFSYEQLSRYAREAGFENDEDAVRALLANEPDAAREIREIQEEIGPSTYDDVLNIGRSIDDEFIKTGDPEFIEFLQEAGFHSVDDYKDALSRTLINAERNNFELTDPDQRIVDMIDSFRVDEVQQQRAIGADVEGDLRAEFERGLEEAGGRGELIDAEVVRPELIGEVDEAFDEKLEKFHFLLAKNHPSFVQMEQRRAAMEADYLESLTPEERVARRRESAEMEKLEAEGFTDEEIQDIRSEYTRWSDNEKLLRQEVTDDLARQAGFKDKGDAIRAWNLTEAPGAEPDPKVDQLRLSIEDPGMAQRETQRRIQVVREWQDIRGALDHDVAEFAGMHRARARNLIDRVVAGDVPFDDPEVVRLREALERKISYQRLDDLKAEGIDPLAFISDDVSTDQLTKLQMYAYMERKTGRRDWAIGGGSDMLTERRNWIAAAKASQDPKFPKSLNEWIRAGRPGAPGSTPVAPVRQATPTSGPAILDERRAWIAAARDNAGNKNFPKTVDEWIAQGRPGAAGAAPTPRPSATATRTAPPSASPTTSRTTMPESNPNVKVSYTNVRTGRRQWERTRLGSAVDIARRADALGHVDIEVVDDRLKRYDWRKIVPTTERLRKPTPIPAPPKTGPTTVIYGGSRKTGENQMYIGRPSKWGNPFAIGKDGNRAEVITKYENWIRKQTNLLNDIRKGELKGQALACWCAPKPCHGHILKALSDMTDTQFDNWLTKGGSALKIASEDAGTPSAERGVQKMIERRAAAKQPAAPEVTAPAPQPKTPRRFEVSIVGAQGNFNAEEFDRLEDAVAWAQREVAESSRAGQYWGDGDTIDDVIVTDMIYDKTDNSWMPNYDAEPYWTWRPGDEVPAGTTPSVPNAQAEQFNSWVVRSEPLPVTAKYDPYASKMGGPWKPGEDPNPYFILDDGTRIDFRNVQRIDPSTSEITYKQPSMPWQGSGTFDVVINRGKRGTSTQTYSTLAEAMYNAQMETIANTGKYRFKRGLIEDLFVRPTGAAESVPNNWAWKKGDAIPERPKAFERTLDQTQVSTPRRDDSGFIPPKELEPLKSEAIDPVEQARMRKARGGLSAEEYLDKKADEIVNLHWEKEWSAQRIAKKYHVSEADVQKFIDRKALEAFGTKYVPPMKGGSGETIPPQQSRGAIEQEVRDNAYVKSVDRELDRALAEGDATRIAAARAKVDEARARYRWQGRPYGPHVPGKPGAPNNRVVDVLTEHLGVADEVAQDAAIYDDIDRLRMNGIDPDGLDADELKTRYQKVGHKDGEPIPPDEWTEEDTFLMSKILMYAEMERVFGHRKWQIRGADDLEKISAKIERSKKKFGRTTQTRGKGASPASKAMSRKMLQAQQNVIPKLATEPGVIDVNRYGEAIYGIQMDQEARLFELMGMSADTTAALQTGGTPGQQLAQSFASGLTRARKMGGGPNKPWLPLIQGYQDAVRDHVGVTGRFDRLFRKILGPVALIQAKPSAMMNQWERALMASYHQMESMFHLESRLLANEISSQLANNFEFAPNNVQRLAGAMKKHTAGDFGWTLVEPQPGQTIHHRLQRTVGGKTYYSTIHVLQNPGKYNLTNKMQRAIAAIDVINDQIYRMDRKWNLLYGKFHTTDPKGIYVPQKWFFEQDDTAEGAKWFMNKRTIPDIEAGVQLKNAAGDWYEPVTWNPLEMYALRLYTGARARAKAGLDRLIDQLFAANQKFIDPKTLQAYGPDKVKDRMNTIFDPAVFGSDTMYKDVRAITSFARTTVLGGDLSPIIGIQGMRFFTDRGPIHFLFKAAEAGSYIMSHEGWKAYLQKEFPTMLEMVRWGKGNIFNTALDIDPLDILTPARGAGKPFRGWKQVNNVMMTRATVVYKIELYKQYRDLFKGASKNDDLFNILDLVPNLENKIRNAIGAGLRKWKQQTIQLTKPLTGKVDYTSINPRRALSYAIEDIKIDTAPLSNERISELAMMHLDNMIGGHSPWKGNFRAFFEEGALFTPNWFRANVGLLGNVVNPGIEGLLARRYLLKWFATHALIAEVMSLTFTGEHANVFDPSEGDWLAIKGPAGMIVHTSGTTRSMLRPLYTQENHENLVKARLSPTLSWGSQMIMGEEAFAYDRPEGQRGLFSESNWWRNAIRVGGFTGREFFTPIAIQNLWEAAENYVLNNEGVDFVEALYLIAPDMMGFFDYIPGATKEERQDKMVAQIWEESKHKAPWNQFSEAPTYQWLDDNKQGLLEEVDDALKRQSQEGGWLPAEPPFIAPEDYRISTNDELEEFLASELDREDFADTDPMAAETGTRIAEIRDELLHRYRYQKDKRALKAIQDAFDNEDWEPKRQQEADIQLDHEMRVAQDAWVKDHRESAQDAIVRMGTNDATAQTVPTAVLMEYNPKLEDALNNALETAVREGYAQEGDSRFLQKTFLDAVYFHNIGGDVGRRNPEDGESWYQMDGFEQEILLANNPDLKHLHDEWIKSLPDDDPDKLETSEFNNRRINILQEAAFDKQVAFDKFLASSRSPQDLAELRTTLADIEDDTRDFFADLMSPTGMAYTSTGWENEGGDYGNAIWWERELNRIAAQNNDPKGWYQVMQDERAAISAKYDLTDPIERELWAETLALKDLEWAERFNDMFKDGIGGKNAWQFILDYRDQFDDPYTQMERNANNYIASTPLFDTNDWVNEYIPYPKILQGYLNDHQDVQKIFNDLGVDPKTFNTFFDLSEAVMAGIAALDSFNGGTTVEGILNQEGGLLGKETEKKLKEWAKFMHYGEEAGAALYDILKQPSTLSETDPNPLWSARQNFRNGLFDADPKLDVYYNFWHPAKEDPNNIAPHNPNNEYLTKGLFAVVVDAVNPLEGGGVPTEWQADAVLRGEAPHFAPWVTAQNDVFITPAGGPVTTPVESEDSGGSGSGGGSSSSGFNGRGGGSGGSGGSSSSSVGASAQFDAPSKEQITDALRTFYNESSTKWRQNGLKDPNMITAMFFTLGEFINQMPPVFRAGLGERISQVLSDPNLQAQDENSIVSLMGDVFHDYFLSVEDITALTADGLRLVSETPEGLIFEDPTDGTLILLKPDGKREVLNSEGAAPAVQQPAPSTVAPQALPPVFEDE